MAEQEKHTFPKTERLSSVILIEKLFAGGSKSLPAFPLRIVYMPVEGEELPAVSVLISVTKKRFKLHASDEIEEKVKKLLQITAERML